MIKQQIEEIRSTLPQGVKLVAVSKFNPIEALSEAYSVGQRIFGESHVQELLQKYEALPKDIEWHFIGHLQTNKVKQIVPFISLIHAVDSEKLMLEINKQAIKIGRTIPILLELHIASEATKYGFSIDDCRKMLELGEWKEMTGIRIAGIMCMASNTDDTDRIHNDFKKAHDFFLEAKQTFFANIPYFKECSWGMSHDYPIAITEGSTMVRVGSKIFGERMYQ